MTVPEVSQRSRRLNASKNPNHQNTPEAWASPTGREGYANRDGESPRLLEQTGAHSLVHLCPVGFGRVHHRHSQSSLSIHVVARRPRRSPAHDGQLRRATRVRHRRSPGGEASESFLASFSSSPTYPLGETGGTGWVVSKMWRKRPGSGIDCQDGPGHLLVMAQEDAAPCVDRRGRPLVTISVPWAHSLWLRVSSGLTEIEALTQGFRSLKWSE